MRRLIALFALAVTTAHASAQVSFGETIVPVLKSKCAGCHLTGQEAGQLALHPGAAYASLVGVRSSEVDLLRVEAGAPEQSYLLMKLEGTHIEHGGKGARMPFGAPPLDGQAIANVRQWIADGAPEN